MKSLYVLAAIAASLMTLFACGDVVVDPSTGGSTTTLTTATTAGSGGAPPSSWICLCTSPRGNWCGLGVDPVPPDATCNCFPSIPSCPASFDCCAGKSSGDPCYIDGHTGVCTPGQSSIPGLEGPSGLLCKPPVQPACGAPGAACPCADGGAGTCGWLDHCYDSGGAICAE
jgi:hypothetical protein